MKSASVSFFNVFLKLNLNKTAWLSICLHNHLEDYLQCRQDWQQQGKVRSRARGALPPLARKIWKENVILLQKSKHNQIFRNKARWKQIVQGRSRSRVIDLHRCGHPRSLETTRFSDFLNRGVVKKVFFLRLLRSMVKLDQNFHICLRSNPPPLTVSLTVKNTIFLWLPLYFGIWWGVV